MKQKREAGMARRIMVVGWIFNGLAEGITWFYNAGGKPLDMPVAVD